MHLVNPLKILSFFKLIQNFNFFIKSFKVLPWKYFPHFFERWGLSRDECCILFEFKNYEHDNIHLVTAMLNEPLASTSKSKSMGLVNFDLQLEQNHKLGSILDEDKKLAIKSLVAKNILIDENRNPFLGDFALIKLSSKFLRSKKEILEIKMRNRGLESTFFLRDNFCALNGTCPSCGDPLHLQGNYKTCEKFNGVPQSNLTLIRCSMIYDDDSFNSIRTIINGNELYQVEHNNKNDKLSIITNSNSYIFEVPNNFLLLNNSSLILLINELKNNNWHFNYKLN